MVGYIYTQGGVYTGLYTPREAIYRAIHTQGGYIHPGRHAGLYTPSRNIPREACWAIYTYQDIPREACWVYTPPGY